MAEDENQAGAHRDASAYNPYSRVRSTAPDRPTLSYEEMRCKFDSKNVVDLRKLLALVCGLLLMGSCSGTWMEERHRSDRKCSLGGEMSEVEDELGPEEFCNIVGLEGQDSQGRMRVKFGETACSVRHHGLPLLYVSPYCWHSMKRFIWFCSLQQILS